MTNKSKTSTTNKTNNSQNNETYKCIVLVCNISVCNVKNNFNCSSLFSVSH